MQNYSRSKTPHQQRVEALMLRAHQAVPDLPCIPPLGVRILRARLIMEETLETIKALGVDVCLVNHELTDMLGVRLDGLDFVAGDDCDLGQVADGCADISVVTIGTLSACGIADDALLNLVDGNNLAKIGPGHKHDAAGKLIKPAGHKPPDIEGLLRQQAQDAGVDAVEYSHQAGQGCAE